ncbi:MAG TPA: hypothetical protein PLW93_06505, partial [Candidatus Absconditabacterales bacterium]|nr:hypothetical protein [Candidatus Absconditabacterales bacterium]
RHIAGIDNSVPFTTETLDPAINKLKAKLEQAQENSEKELLTKQIDNLERVKTLTNNNSTFTQAMHLGLAENVSDNEYKTKAQEAVALIDEYEKIYKDLAARFDYGDRESQDYINGLYSIKAQSKNYEVAITQREKVINSTLNSFKQDLINAGKNADVAVVELADVIARIEAGERSLAKLKEYSNSGNEIKTEDEAKVVINNLRDKGNLRVVYNNNIDKSPIELAKLMLDAYGKELESITAELESNKKNLVAKRKNLESALLLPEDTLEGLEQAPIDVIAGVKEDAVKKLDAAQDRLINNFKNQYKDFYDKLEELKIDKELLDKTFNDVSNKKGKS